MEPFSSIGRRQFIWGLTSGVTVLAMAGMGWFAIGVSTSGVELSWAAWAIPTLASVALVIASRRLRRKAAGFGRADLKRLGPSERSETRRMLRDYLWVGVGEAIGIVVVLVSCRALGRPDLISSLIGLVVGLHFIPLGRIFRVPTYIATGVVSSSVALFALLALGGWERFLFLGLCSGLVYWLSAVHILLTTEKIVTQAVGLRTETASM
jgi:hypothetical protein